MSWFGKLFGGSGDTTATPEAETYKGFTITPVPMREGKQFRLSAKIEKDIDGTLKTQNVIRADTLGSVEEANKVAIMKAKQVIDEQGDQLFG